MDYIRTVKTLHNLMHVQKALNIAEHYATHVGMTLKIHEVSRMVEDDLAAINAEMEAAIAAKEAPHA